MTTIEHQANASESEEYLRLGRVIIKFNKAQLSCQYLDL